MRAIAVTVTAGLVVLSWAGTAAAGGNDGHHVHAQGRGRFMPIPLPDNYGSSIGEFADCGTMLSVSDGDVFKLKERDTDKKNGTLTEAKGAFTSDITADDGRMIDELDNSGPYTEFDANDGSVTVVVSGPSFIFPYSPGEPAAFAAASLPPAFYFTKGKFIECTDPDGNITVERTPRDATDICELLPTWGDV